MAPASPGAGVQRYLETAARLGRQIVDEAIWHGDRCNWIGAMPEEQGSGGFALTYAALPPDLYGGTAGVAVFLAQLFDAAPEPNLRRTAVAAMNQALSRVDDVPGTAAMGFYGGRTGIGVAAARVGRLVDEPRLIECATSPLAALPDRSEEYDLIAGPAGAVLGLLTLARLLGDTSLERRACDLGARLIEVATPEPQGLSWGSPSLPVTGNLTGLSHGAAGVGLSFLELFQATGDARFRAAAEQAFAYERSLYDPGVKNWPDLRDLSSRLGQAAEGVTFATFWCHGAPGIALSRIRALQLLNDEAYRGEALAALGTTSGWVSSMLASGIGNFSLCHGLAGNGDILLDGRGVVGIESERLAYRVGDSGIDGYASTGTPWPCGTHEGQTTGLMLGLAGIGYFYLRLYDPLVPSLLLPCPEQLA